MHFFLGNRKLVKADEELAANALEAAAGVSARSAYPNGFNWPLSGGVWDDFYAIKNGDSYECSVKPEDLIDLSEYENTIYVDIDAVGSDDGSSWADAFNSINDAVSEANSTGVNTKILIKGGIYNRAEDVDVISLTSNIALIACYGRVVSGPFDNLTWSQNATYSTVYEASRSLTNVAVDPSRVDANGDYLLYEELGSIAEVSSNPGSWYTDNSTVYIHAIDSAIVTNKNARCYVSDDGAEISGNNDVYMYGIDFESGNDSPLKVSGGSTNTVVADNCTFKYGCGGTAASRNLRDGAQILGCKLFAAFDCQASKNSKDGFNLHAEGEVYPSMLTVRCSGFSNGVIDTSATSSNGHTTHDGCKAIDIGGNYRGSVGAQCGYVNDGTQTWLFGTEFGESDGDEINGGPISFGGAGAWDGEAELWVEGGRNEGVAIGLYSGSDATIHYRNHSGMGVQGGSGVFEEF